MPDIGIQQNQKTPCRIALIGAAGGIGQSLALLLKTGLATRTPPPDLLLCDVNAQVLPGVCADLAHINTLTRVSQADSLAGTDIVVIAAGIPRKPGMTRDDLFATNAAVVRGVAARIATECADNPPFVLLITNPLNSLVPLLDCELGARFRGRVFGVTELDVVRASTFLHEALRGAGVDDAATRTTGATATAAAALSRMPYVPVVGGHSGATIVPLLSQAEYNNSIHDAEQSLAAESVRAVVRRVQYGGEEVVAAKNGAGSATLSMAYAAFVTVERFVGLCGGESAEVRATLYTSVRDEGVGGVRAVRAAVGDGCGYFAVPCSVVRGRGLVAVHPLVLEKMSGREREELLPGCVEQLVRDIKKGEAAHVMH